MTLTYNMDVAFSDTYETLADSLEVLAKLCPTSWVRVHGNCGSGWPNSSEEGFLTELTELTEWFNNLIAALFYSQYSRELLAEKKINDNYKSLLAPQDQGIQNNKLKLLFAALFCKVLSSTAIFLSNFLSWLFFLYKLFVHHK